MKIELRTQYKNDKGSATVLVAVAMVAFCALAALVIDAGTLYLQRAQLSQGTDAAVLAAAQELPRDHWQALTKGYQYAYKNKLEPTQIIFQVSADDRVIKADSQVRVNYLFARIFGLLEGRTKAKATVKVSNISVVKGVAPLGIIEDDYQYGLIYTLKEGGGSGEIGWYGALALDGNGASIYENSLMYGSSATIHLGDQVDTEAGNISGNTRDGITYLLNACNHQPRCSPSSFDLDCSRILKVPIIRPLRYDNGHLKQVQVVGFAAFLVSNVSGNGNESIIDGAFIQYVTDGETAENAPDYGLYTARMID